MGGARHLADRRADDPADDHPGPQPHGNRKQHEVDQSSGNLLARGVERTVVIRRMEADLIGRARRPEIGRGHDGEELQEEDE
jgi:hypothetical protein